MKNTSHHLAKVLFVLLSFASSAWGQREGRTVDLCKIAAHPMDFNGQTVRVRGNLESTMETYVIAKDDCAAIPLEQPAYVRRNSAFKKLERLNRANAKQTQCVGPCPKGPFYDPIIATLIGRVDAVPESAVEGVAAQRRGFGNRHSSTMRIVVKSYIEVEDHKASKPISHE